MSNASRARYGPAPHLPFRELELAFGHDGHLFVAEAGSGGGSLSTNGLCDQVSPPVGPFVAGHSGRILEFSAPETSDVIASGLPSTEASPAIGGDKSSAAALAFIARISEA